MRNTRNVYLFFYPVLLSLALAKKFFQKGEGLMQTAELGTRERAIESMRWVLYFNPDSIGHLHLREEVARSKLLHVDYRMINFGAQPKLVTPSGSFWSGMRIIRNVLIHGSFLNTFMMEARHAES